MMTCNVITEDEFSISKAVVYHVVLILPPIYRDRYQIEISAKCMDLPLITADYGGGV